jgi:hypothetical protein
MTAEAIISSPLSSSSYSLMIRLCLSERREAERHELVTVGLEEVHYEIEERKKEIERRKAGEIRAGQKNK